jgi:hypothetical protein
MFFIQDHPVIRQLVEQRELIGKLRAVDAEVSNQMAALRAAVAAGPIAARQNDAAKIDKPIRSARSLDKQANTSEKRAGKTSESKGRRARSRDATAVGAAPKRGFAKPSKCVLGPGLWCQLVLFGFKFTVFFCCSGHLGRYLCCYGLLASLWQYWSLPILPMAFAAFWIFKRYLGKLHNLHFRKIRQS